MKIFFLIINVINISFFAAAIQPSQAKTFGKMLLITTPPEQITVIRIIMQEGTNTIHLPGNKGTVTLLKKADFFSNINFTDKVGNTFRLLPKPCGNAACAFPIRDACFGNDQTAVINICRQTNASNNAGPFTIMVLLAGKK